MDPKKYPPDCKEISRFIRRERAKGRCECNGECGLHKTHPGPRRCTERNGKPAKWAKGKVVLTVAHRDYPGGPCHCEEQTGKKCGNPEHLYAACQRCHLRADRPRHASTRKATRDRKSGQPDLFKKPEAIVAACNAAGE